MSTLREPALPQPLPDGTHARSLRRASSVRVSVVIPVRDDAELLHRCLATLAAQTSPADEVIVVDNGSSDHSADVARQAGARVIVEPVLGIGSASAAGYDAALGDVVARLDADGEAPPDWIARIRDRFDADPELVALTGGAHFSDGPRALRRVGAVVYLGAYVAALSIALGHVPLFGSNCAFRRDAWRLVSDVVHRDDLMMHDDIDLSFHLGPESKIRYDSALRMRISARPFRTGLFRLRVRRGFHSVWAHWPEDLPVARLTRRAAARSRVRVR
ncbi:glycosyltransferase family 2 protein [Frigoribacterium sp. 2-23]|uniref:glycosyltransferase family 2 protein n=1 Tax=Frigoribacterium sp. 2-23 TaxID=3415006 RepID=UPI003C6F9E99